MNIKSFIGTIISTLKQDYRQRVCSLNDSEYSNTLKKEGIVVIPNYLDEKVCDELYHKITLFIDNPVDLHPKTDIQIRKSNDGYEDYDTNMVDTYNINFSMKELDNHMKSDFMLDIINQPNLKLLNFNCYINNSVTKTRVYHSDSLGIPQYKAFIYLTDVNTKEDGPYSFIKYSHRFTLKKYYNLINNFLKGFPITDMRSFNKNNIMICTAKKGTLIISNQNGFHRGIPQSEGRNRMLLVNNYSI